jgi:hypothetical protein
LYLTEVAIVVHLKQTRKEQKESGAIGCQMKEMICKFAEWANQNIFVIPYNIFHNRMQQRFHLVQHYAYNDTYSNFFV